jgi:hypothetical protein
MRYATALLFVLSLLAAPGRAAPAAGLFNGADLAGWDFVSVPAADIATVCTVRPDGVIAVAGKPTGYLATTASHHDFQLHAEWRWSGKPGNGGVLLHISSGPLYREWPRSLQVQLKHGNAGDVLPMAGATFAEPLTNAPTSPPAVKARIAPETEKPAGEWNTCDITCRGGTIEVMINGVRQNHVTGVNPSAGRVGFQLEGSAFELRNVRLTPLD